MTTNGSGSNGDTPIATAIAILLQNQAQFVTQQAALAAQIAETNRLHLQYEREANERVTRIETQMGEVIRILTDDNRRLEQLTDAVRDRIGFKS